MELNPTLYRDFAQDFFTLHQCKIIEESSHHFKVKLTSDIDEEIMNRPFYWHYMKKMNRSGDPATLSFHLSQSENHEGIYLHAGTPKLHTLYRTAMKKGKMTRLYEATDVPNHHEALTPWFAINVLLHYRGKQTRNEHLALGLNLINGSIIPSFTESIWSESFKATVTDYTFPMTPIINLRSAYKRIEGYIESYVSRKTHEWAQQSIEQLKEEVTLLKSFYESGDMEEEQYQKEYDQLKERYEPRIIMEVINGGLFYLSGQTNAKLFKQLG
ncbi:hypothetical protein EQV77_02030 [Halobacillus fulvus]|nr:hypothetical protein EQV77_02030 [Halobacillus fulvus]